MSDPKEYHRIRGDLSVGLTAVLDEAEYVYALAQKLLQMTPDDAEAARLRRIIESIEHLNELRMLEW